jgi:hypothetical protein
MAKLEKQYSLRKIKQPTDEYLSDVKQTLINKGLATEYTPYSELDDVINDIELKETWENLDLESKKIIISKDYDYVYYHSNGVDAYGSYSSSTKQGIYHLNVLTKEENKIYTSGNDWKYFFEYGEGNVYVGSSKSIGIIHLSGKTAKQIYSDGYLWQYFFEDSKGNVYVSSESNNSSCTGVLYLNGETITKIYKSDYGWQHFTEKPQGVIVAKTEQPDGQDFLLIDENPNVYLVKE